MGLNNFDWVLLSSLLEKYKCEDILPMPELDEEFFADYVKAVDKIICKLLLKNLSDEDVFHACVNCMSANERISLFMPKLFSVSANDIEEEFGIGMEVQRTLRYRGKNKIKKHLGKK